MDAIAHLERYLQELNEAVRVLQLATFEQRQKVDEQETRRQQNVHGKIEAHATLAAGKFLTKVKTLESVTQGFSQMFWAAGGGASVSSNTPNDTDTGTGTLRVRVRVLR